MPRPRPTEVKLVKRLITEEEWESEDELAAAIIAQLDEMRGRDRSYYVLVVHRGPILHAYGPYDTAKQADRARLAGTGQEGARAVAVVPMTTPQQARAALEEA